jgi:putative two-component system response regulator
MKVPEPRDSFPGAPDRLRLLRDAAHILVIDDEVMNLMVISQMLRRAGYKSIATLTDARELESHILQHPPDLVILDLHMPERDGFSVLEALQSQIHEEFLPVLVLSGDLTIEARRHALAHGARDFLAKPFDLIELTLRVRNQLDSRLLFHDARKQNRALLETIRGTSQQLEHARVERMERLAAAAEYRDDDTSRHTRRVGELSARIAHAAGLRNDQVNVMARAAALHDLGKIGIPDALLLKPARLTDEEVRIMQTHTTIGASILSGSADPLLQLAEVIALSHHERWDGTGYPLGLIGQAIPLPGRIVAVADAFDAMTNDRPYRPARSREEAFAEITAGSGTQFDRDLVEVFKVVLVEEGDQERSSSPAKRSYNSIA